jgi:hypothetical protein
VPLKATSERAPKCSPPLFAQQVAAAFSFEVSFLLARRLLATLPREAPVRSESSLFDLVASRQCSGWAPPFSLPPGRSVLALLPQPAACAPAQVQCLASALFPEFAMLLPPFSFSPSGLESSRRSEIDPEDSPKSPPVLDSSAHRRSKHHCTERRELLRANASGKSSAPSREGQIDGRLVPPSRGQEKRLWVELSPEKKTLH